jgi:hypothetical protein
MCGSGVIRTSPFTSSIAVVQARPLRPADVHRAAAADPLAARPAKGERRILLRLHLDQRVEHHRPAAVEIDLERVVARILAAVGIVTIHFERFDRARVRRRLVDAALALDPAVLR